MGYSTGNIYKPIPTEELEERVGKKIHVAWARNSCVWVLKGVDGEWADIQTPKTQKKLRVRVSDLRKLSDESNIIPRG